MNPKYQVFVSSTYEDLKDEREQVIRAVLEMGHIPVGMEMFSAADEEQWKIIARHIEESDYYVVVVAHRYGTVDEGGISYTRKEYEFARSQGVPILGFIIDGSATWPADRVDTDDVSKTALDAFKARLREKPVATWKSADDLHGSVSIALMKAITANPRPGWIPATAATSPEVAGELSRLSAENAQLRKALQAAEDQAERDRATEIDHLRSVLRQNEVPLNYRYKDSRGQWEQAGEESLWALFIIVAPSLQVQYSVEDAAHLIALHIRDDNDRVADIIPINLMKDIFASLASLGLLKPSERKKQVSDSNEYWTLTELGRDLLNDSKRRTLLAAQAQDDEWDEPDGGLREPPTPSATKAPSKKAPAKKAPAKKAPAKK